MTYISREAAIDDLTHTLFYDQRDKATAKELIATLPPADVKPVVKGEWVVETCNDGFCEYELYHCSRCDEISPRPRNFCHNCGADMRKEASDER